MSDMHDPEVTRRVREEIATEAKWPPARTDGPLPVPTLAEIFGLTQRQEGERLREHIFTATELTVERRLCVYSWDPPSGFHYVVVDPVTRCSVSLHPEGSLRHRTDLQHSVDANLMITLATCHDPDPRRPGWVRDRQWVGDVRDDWPPTDAERQFKDWCVREVPIGELL